VKTQLADLSIAADEVEEDDENTHSFEIQDTMIDVGAHVFNPLLRFGLWPS
jgi:hypothetical protein